MRGTFAIPILIGSLFLGSGCATKKYVHQNVEPLEKRVDQIADENTKQNESLGQIAKDVDAHDTEISAAKERLGTVEGRAGEALSRVERNEHALSELRSIVANLDDYQPADQGVVHFGFDKDTLTPEAQQELDRVASSVAERKRYFVTVEGFTDQIGPEDYNYQLSRRRADRVVRYLAAEHGIPVQRIYVIGLGENKPIEEGTTQEARAQNRRVEITVFSADATSAVAEAH